MNARRAFVVTFLLVWASAAMWAFALPRGAGPDEPAHIRKAAATARGQVFGDPTPGLPSGARTVRIPGAFDNVQRIPCFADGQNANITAECMPAPTTTGDVDSVTTSGKYPPLSYLPAGLATVVVPRYRGWYLARLLSAGAIAGFVATALTLAGRRGLGRAGHAALLLALTPTTVFLAGVVNPNGWEIGSAILAWVGWLAVVRAPAVDRRALVAFVVGAVALTLTRTLSPVWLIMILVVGAMTAERGRLRALARDHAIQLAAVIVAVAVVLQAVWVAAAGLTDTADASVADHQPIAAISRFLVFKSGLLYRQMIGQFGWYEVNAPTFVILAWTLAIAAIVIVALLFGRRRGALALGAAVLATAVLPVLADLNQARHAGLVWQGRYTLPIAVGVPIVAAFTIGSTPELRGRVGRRLASVVGGLFVVAHVVGFYWAERRYTVGTDRTAWFWTQARWRPPLGGLVWLVLDAVVISTLAWWVLMRLPGREPVDVA